MGGGAFILWTSVACVELLVFKGKFDTVIILNAQKNL